MRYLILILIGFIIIPFQIYAQAFPQYDYKYFDVKSGLKGNEIHGIAKDKFGLLWLATNNGLIRFDGQNYYNFEVSANPSQFSPMPGNYRGLLLHSDGTMWVCNDLTGVSKYNSINHTFTHYLEGDKDTNLADAASYLMREDEHKNIWFAHFFKGISMYNYSTKKFEKFRHNPNNTNTILEDKIYALLPDKKGGIWIGYQNQGISYYHFKDKQFTHYTKENNCGIGTNEIFTFALDNTKKLWIGTINGLYFKEPNSNIFHAFANSKLPKITFYNSVFNSKNGLLFLASSYGVYCVNTINNDINLYTVFKETKGKVDVNRCTNIFLDNTQNLWVQYHDGFCSFTNKINHLKKNEGLIPEISKNRSNYYEIIKDNIAYSISNKKIFAYHLTTKALDTANFPSTFKEGPSIIFKPNQYSNYLLIKNSTQMYLYHVTTNKLQEIKSVFENQLIQQDHIYQAMVDRNGNIWLLDEHLGILNFNFSTKKWSNVTPENHKINSIFFYYSNTFLEDKYGNIWCSNPFLGLIKFNKGETENPILIKKRKSNKPFNKIILAMCEANDGTIYFAGKGKYLDAYIPAQDLFIHYSRTACFDDNPANMVQDNLGNFWCFNHQSIYKFKPSLRTKPYLEDEDIDDFNYQNFDWKNGFEGTYLGNNAVFVTAENTIYFDANDGLFSMNPQQWVANNSIKPKVEFINFKVNGNIDDAIFSNAKLTQLKSNENNIEISFASNSLINAQSNIYKYKLLNWDNEWHYTNSFFAKAVYNSLSSGKYTFQILTLNSDGEWSEKTHEITFEINPNFLETPLFKILMVVLLLTIIITFFQLRLLQLKKVIKIRNKLSRDLHDNIGANVSSASFSANFLKSNFAKIELRDKLVSKIETDLRTVGQSLDEIVWSINPNNDTWSQLTAKMLRYGADLFENTDINFNFQKEEVNENKSIGSDARKEIYLIYKECLTNIIKHAKAKKVEVKFIQNKKKTIMSISDNGIGFDPKSNSARNGLKNMKNRAELSGCILKINSSLTEGTEILLEIK